jgi:hypothetical protein
LENDRGSVSLAAGQSGLAETGIAPRPNAHDRDGAGRDGESLEGKVMRLERENASLRAELRLKNALRDNLLAQKPTAELPSTDETPAWPRETPEQFREPAFSRLMKDAAGEAGSGAELVGVSCDEPPCIAMFRLAQSPTDDDTSWLKRLQRTAPWSESYTNEIGLMQTEVECGDGRKEAVALVAKGSDEWSDEVKYVAQKRRGVRFEALKEKWICASPGGAAK